jgi:copper chaperone CopZ
MTTATYTITGMTCQGCVRRVQAALAPLADSVTVSLAPPQAVLNQPKGGIEQIAQALNGSNYAAVEQIAPPQAPPAAPNWLQTYRPLLLLVSLIFVCSLLGQLPSGAITVNETMRLFMAGFFIAFSFFKLLDIRAFASAYAGYDLLAARWPTWGLLYPFVELSLGLAYLANWQPRFINLVTLLVMAFSAIGVIKAVMDKRQIRCACLGTVFQLPMSTVTIVEDLAMVGMAALMLV